MRLWDEIKPVVQAIPQQPQAQDALLDQLIVLKQAAARLGLYDAADYLRDRIDTPMGKEW